MRHSGLQREVLSLYGRFVKAARQRNDLSALHAVRSEFERHKNVSIRDVTTIEHLIRRGTHQLEWFAKSDIRSVSHWNPTRP